MECDAICSGFDATCTECDETLPVTFTTFGLQITPFIMEVEGLFRGADANGCVRGVETVVAMAMVLAACVDETTGTVNTEGCEGSSGVDLDDNGDSNEEDDGGRLEVLDSCIVLTASWLRWRTGFVCGLLFLTPIMTTILQGDYN